MPGKTIIKISDFYNGKIYSLAFWASLIILFFLILFRVLLISTYNGEIGGIDNNFVYAVIRSMAGYDIYPDPSSAPFAVNPYTPLYINFCSLLGKIFSLNIKDPINVYRLCRAVSLACDILTCSLFFLTLKNLASLKKEIVLFITVVLASLLCYLGYTYSRADSLFLLMYALTFFVLTTNASNPSLPKIVLLSLLTVACIFSKQNGIILPFLVFIWYLFNNSLNHALMYGAAIFLLLTGSILLYQNTSNHPFFLHHTVHALRNRIDFSWFYVYIFKRLSDSLILLPLYFAAGFSISWLSQNKLKKKSLSIIFLIQIIFSLGTSLKFGASVGYFNEAYFLGLLIAGIFFSEQAVWGQGLTVQKIITWLLPLVILFNIHVLAQGYLFFIQGQDEKRKNYQKQVAVRDYLQPKLNSNHVLNLGNQNTDFFKTLFYKEAVVPNFDAVSCCTLPDKTFDYSLFFDELNTGKINHLLMEEKEILTELWGTSLEHFRKDTSMNGYVIFSFSKE
jgi:hypothetical protein